MSIQPSTQSTTPQFQLLIQPIFNTYISSTIQCLSDTQLYNQLIQQISNTHTSGGGIPFKRYKLQAKQYYAQCKSQQHVVLHDCQLYIKQYISSIDIRSLSINNEVYDILCGAQLPDQLIHVINAYVSDEHTLQQYIVCYSQFVLLHNAIIQLLNYYHINTYLYIDDVMQVYSNLVCKPQLTKLCQSMYTTTLSHNHNELITALPQLVAHVLYINKSIDLWCHTSNLVQSCYMILMSLVKHDLIESSNLKRSQPLQSLLHNTIQPSIDEITMHRSNNNTNDQLDDDVEPHCCMYCMLYINTAISNILTLL